MPEHVVRQGDCISSIADRYGLFWQTIWNHGQNSQLRQERRNPNVLYPGDVVFVPDRQEKRESGATDQRHRFRKRGVPAKVRIRLLLDDEPRANEPYRFCIDGEWREGTTDGDGYIEESIPPNAQQGEILLGEGESQDVYEFAFGTVDPVDTDEGVQHRLSDLGFDVEEDPEAAVKEFQAKEELEATGTVDQATRDRLKGRFGQ